MHHLPPLGMQVDKEEDSGVSVAYAIDVTTIEQQLQTRIYEMSREEAKA